MIQWSIAVVEIVVLIAILLLLFFPGFKLDPDGNARLYPRAIRERYYQIHERPAEESRKRRIAGRLVAVLVISAITAAFAFASGARGFPEGFLFGLTVFLVVRVWNDIVFGCFILPRARSIRLPGTEDMDAEYSDKGCHLRSFAYPGIPNAVMVGLVTGAILFLVG